MSTDNIGEVILMSAQNIGFYEEIRKNYPLIIIKYHQMCTLSLLWDPLDYTLLTSSNIYFLSLCLLDKLSGLIRVQTV